MYRLRTTLYVQIILLPTELDKRSTFLLHHELHIVVLVAIRVVRNDLSPRQDIVVSPLLHLERRLLGRRGHLGVVLVAYSGVEVLGSSLEVLLEPRV